MCKSRVRWSMSLSSLEGVFFDRLWCHELRKLFCVSVSSVKFLTRFVMMVPWRSWW